MNAKKFNTRSGLAGFAFALMITGAASAGEPYGVWVRPSNGTQIQFYDCGGKLCAKIVAIMYPSLKGEIGTVIMHGATKSGDNKWQGDLLDVVTGKTYSGVVTLESASALNLKDCFFVICKGETWRRVK